MKKISKITLENFRVFSGKNEIDFNDTLQEIALIHYLDWYVVAHPHLHDEEKLPANALKLRYLEKLVSNQHMRNKVAHTLLSAHLFMSMLGADISETIPFVYREYLKVSTDPETCEYVQAQLKIIDNTSVGMPAADLKMVDINGKRISLKDIVGKGKYTYIDFWATWCGPCCKEIPFIEKLVEKHKNNSIIRFVSVSIDTDVDAWKRKLAADKPDWEQYLVPEMDQKAYAEIYGITNIPRFMLFDKEGILNIDELVAQRPTFRKIMEDQIVTDDELTNQANLVVNLLKKLEQTLSPGQLSEVENLLAEMSVLYAIHQYKEIQDLKL